MSIGPRFIAFPALVLVLCLTGCALQATATPGTCSGVSLSGKVHGRQQAVTGAHVQLLAASVTGSLPIASGRASSVNREYTFVAATI